MADDNLFAGFRDGPLAADTPLMRQYNKVKSEHPEALVLFRMGDFYESFGRDAIETSRILGITLTKRANGAASNIELAGFPYHALDTYLPKLVRAGKRVAICEQLEDPKLAKGLVKRGVTEVVTPGLALNDCVLQRSENNFLASLSPGKSGLFGLALVDISTGEFYLTQGNATATQRTIGNFKPREILVQRDLELPGFVREDILVTRMEPWAFDVEDATRRLTQLYGTHSLRGFGIEDYPLGISAAGSILAYLELTRHDQLAHIARITRLDTEQYLWLDPFTLRNLEVFQPIANGGRTLLETIDRTQTPMGGRLLRRWLALPLRDIEAIEARQGAIEALRGDRSILMDMRAELEGMPDLERLASRIATRRIHPKELKRTAYALEKLAPLQTLATACKEEHLNGLGDGIDTCEALLRRLRDDLVSEPSALGQDKIFAMGVSQEMDELRNIQAHGEQYLDTLLAQEIKRTGIASLKVGLNNVFGYYFEVRNTHRALVPSSWTRKQTLTQAERYISEELKALEEKMQGAKARALQLEAELYESLIQELQPYVGRLMQNAIRIAELDCLSSLAHLADEKGWVRPVVNESFGLSIEDGCHPVIAEMLPPGREYIPNSVRLDNEDSQIMMITGPNMSGKSALLRQTALIVLLAQIGSCVPAKGAEMGIVDRIFTRVGASDNISAGESTFMVEMTEAASILNNLSDRSLVLLDELGRGTSTYDGISIAWAMAEYLHEHPKYHPKTLFATHYHELNAMEERFARIKNFSIAVREVNGEIIFLRNLVEGGSEHSFGIHVAQIAGMPPQVIARASEMLKRLELQRAEKGEEGTPESPQWHMFQIDDPLWGIVKQRLASLDINSMTPIQALGELEAIRQILGI